MGENSKHDEDILGSFNLFSFIEGVPVLCRISYFI